jgi:hypothetical protein
MWSDLSFDQVTSLIEKMNKKKKKKKKVKILNTSSVTTSTFVGWGKNSKPHL